MRVHAHGLNSCVLHVASEQMLELGDFSCHGRCLQDVKSSSFGKNKIKLAVLLRMIMLLVQSRTHLLLVHCAGFLVAGEQA